MVKMSLDNLSDAELRRKLVEHGFPAGPVTQTTRNILIKKLKNLIEAKGSGASRHSLAARYSSDETDEDSAVAATRKKKAAAARRQTLANPMPPPLTTSVISSISSTSKSPMKKKEKPPRNSESVDSEYDNVPSVVTTNKTVKKTEQSKFTKMYKVSQINDGLETGSDSDMADEPEKAFVPPKFGETALSYDSRAHSQSITDLGLSTKTYETKPKSVLVSKDDKFSAPQFQSPSATSPAEKRDSAREYGNTSGNSKNDILSNYETPYLSEFTRRLSSRTSINVPSLSKVTPKSPLYRHSSISSEVKESDTNGHYSSSRPLYPSTSRYITSIMDRSREIVKRNIKPTTKTKDDTLNNQNVVSMILVIVLALFFGVLAVAYLGLGGKTDTVPSLSAGNNVVPYCIPNQENQNHPKVNCILQENLGNVFQLLEKLQKVLMQNAIKSVCEDSEVKSYLTDEDVIKMFKSSKVTDFEIKEDLHNAQILIVKNPKWGMSLIEEDSENKGETEVIDTLDQMFSAREAGKLGIQILNPDLPMQCLIKKKVFTLFSSMLVVAFGALLLIGGHKLTSWYMQQKKKTEKEVFQLVSEIISMVEINHQNSVTSSPGGTQESYLAINHVRDNLIPPKNRKRMASTWEKAVKFLDENESRIRREVQQVAGEEFHVWRWLPSSSLNASNTLNSSAMKKSKVWQGQAFETMEGSVNSLLCSPTPCLKIRNMFKLDGEVEDDWETKVKDAILEKCGEGVNIFHINIDRGSREGCVYMKCMSQEDAGKAYRALHGCWYDGRLVTVKYLRLERYHERFPDAVYFTTPLKPSNNQRLSLQSNFWQTPMEAN